MRLMTRGISREGRQEDRNVDRVSLLVVLLKLARPVVQGQARNERTDRKDDDADG